MEPYPRSKIGTTAETESRAAGTASPLKPAGEAGSEVTSDSVAVAPPAAASTPRGNDHTVDGGTSKALATARAALQWYEKSVAARRMQTLGVVGA